jgi:hypothetical protein
MYVCVCVLLHLFFEGLFTFFVGHAFQSSWFQVVLVETFARNGSGGDAALPSNFGLHVVRGNDSVTKVIWLVLCERDV